MTKYIKNKDGKFAGSLPEQPNISSPGGVAVPPLPNAAPAPKTTTPPAFGTPEWHEWAERRRQEREAEEVIRQEALSVVRNFTDKINEEYPESRYFVFDEDWNPVAIEGYDNQVILDLKSEEHGALADTLRIETENCIEGMKKFIDRDYRSPNNYNGVTMLIKCDEAPDCNFRRPARGFAPSHTPSAYCASGKRPHCTCDTCF